MNFSPIEVSGVLSESECFDIIKILQNQASWKLSTDYDAVVNDGYSDTGLLLKSYSIDQTEYLNRHNANINHIANLILERILKKIEPIKFINIEINRYLWNYYNKASNGVPHADMMFDDPHATFASIVVYLNTCDGYTELTDVDKTLIPSVAGNSIIFDSSINHRGITVKNDPRRFVLNIVFKYEHLLNI
jgi:hypothetical protein